MNIFKTVNGSWIAKKILVDNKKIVILGNS